MPATPDAMTVIQKIGFTNVCVEGTPTAAVLAACKLLAASGQPVLFNFWDVSRTSARDLPTRRAISGSTEDAPSAHPMTTASYTDGWDAVGFHAAMFQSR